MNKGHIVQRKEGQTNESEKVFEFCNERRLYIFMVKGAVVDRETQSDSDIKQGTAHADGHKTEDGFL